MDDASISLIYIVRASTNDDKTNHTVERGTLLQMTTLPT